MREIIGVFYFFSWVCEVENIEVQNNSGFICFSYATAVNVMKRKIDEI